MKADSAKVRMILIDNISILNPRTRNKASFSDLVSSIANVGLKKPITVRDRGDGSNFDLVCGQGRLEAFAELGEKEIPAIVIHATDEDCYIKSLVENLARRQHTASELFNEIDSLRLKGYSYGEMAEKTGLSPEYMYSICTLLSKGEHRLLAAVERKIVPHSIALEIARADGGDLQAALVDAYEKKTLPGRQIVAIRKIIEQRKSEGKGRAVAPQLKKVSGKPVTSESLVRAYRNEMERQRQQVKKADLAQNRLLFIISALRDLLADKHFETLLRAEAMPTIPRLLLQRITGEP